jgi:hypothetical protein
VEASVGHNERESGGLWHIFGAFAAISFFLINSRPVYHPLLRHISPLLLVAWFLIAGLLSIFAGLRASKWWFIVSVFYGLDGLAWILAIALFDLKRGL